MEPFSVLATLQLIDLPLPSLQLPTMSAPDLQDFLANMTRTAIKEYSIPSATIILDLLVGEPILIELACCTGGRHFVKEERMCWQSAAIAGTVRTK
jgi:hypothetical protein